MKAWRVSDFGEPVDVMRSVQLAEPTAGPDEVVVRVLAASANFPDVLMCRGEYQDRPPLPFTPGVELCGEVVSLGPGVQNHSVGDRVVGSPELPSGAFAEFAVMRAALAFRAPTALSDVEASGLHVAYQTAWFALNQRAGLRAGETLLVHAAAGGVGSAAVQLGKAAGARVIGVVGSADKVETAYELGADVVINRAAEDFVPRVKDLTGGSGADVIYDPVGGDTFARSTRCIAFEGRLVVVGFASGTIPSIGANDVLLKNYSVIGLHWNLYRGRDRDLVQRCHTALDGLVREGVLRPLISTRIGFEDVPRALQRLADGVTTGRVAYCA